VKSEDFDLGLSEDFDVGALASSLYYPAISIDRAGTLGIVLIFFIQ